MQKPNVKPTPYKFVVDEVDIATYAFETDYQLIYEVRFKNTGYIFSGYPELESNAFELMIRLVLNAAGKRTPSDARIAATIVEIFKAFLAKNEGIIVYICDSSDLRQVARARKFDGWYAYYKGIDFMKINRSDAPA